MMHHALCAAYSICGNNAHKHSSFCIFSIFISNKSISLATQRREIKTKRIVHFKKGKQILIYKVKNWTISCVSAFKTMWGGWLELL